MAPNFTFLLMSPVEGDDALPRGSARYPRAQDTAQDTPPVALSPEDQLRVTAIRTGDQAVFEALYRERYPELFRAAVRLGHSRETADEIVQEVFLALWMRRSTWIVHSSVRAYLHGAIRFRAASVARRDIARRNAEIVDEREFPELAERTSDLETTLDENEIRAALLAAIRALPERQREALILWSRHQMTLTELGEALGVSHVAARKLLRKAQEKLQSIVDRLS